VQRLTSTNCLHVNKKKRKEWEEKTSKKWLSKEEYNKKKNSNLRKNNKGDESDSDFSLIAINKAALSLTSSNKHYNDFLTNSRAIVHITYD
jgi:hypothetical protein